MQEILTEYGLLSAFGMTLQLTLWSAILSLILGTILATMRVSPVAVLRAVGSAYVTIFRNTPLTLILLLASIGVWGVLQVEVATRGQPGYIDSNAFRWAIIGLSAYHAAFVCEALRSGVNTIPLGQAEAARSIGLTFGQSLREIILPQAFRGAITPLGNVLIALTKNTTIAAVLGVAEAAAVMKSVAEFQPGLLILALLLIGGGFVILTVPMGLVTSYLAGKLAVKR